MAMILCSNCGEMVSDKAKKCVHCGAVLIPDEKRHCVECGSELEEGMEECPKCGCPIDDLPEHNFNEKPQKVEVTGVKVTKKTKIIIGIVVALLIVIGATVFGISQYQKQKAEEEYAQRMEEYSDNLKLATVEMLKGAEDAESSANLIKQVWHNSIFKEEDDETDEYTRPYGGFLSDFNEALENLYSDSSFSNKINSIKDNQEEVNGLMKKLKNPPDEYKDAYDAISDFYDAYIALTNCATNPTGNLQTYSSTCNDADNNALNAYKAMKLYLDD